MQYRRPNITPLCLLLILLTMTVACGSPSVEEQPAGESSIAAATEAVADDGNSPGEGTDDVTSEEDLSTPEATEAAPTATTAPQNTATATAPPPTATTEAEPQPLQLVQYGFGQDGEDIGIAFVVENPNDDQVIEGAQYEIAIVDSSGETVDTLIGSIDIVLPGQKLGVGDSRYLGEGVTVDTIEVTLSGGDLVPGEPQPGLTAGAVRFFPEQLNPTITGVIESPYDRDFADVRVSAVLYNADDQIVGGGFTYVNFVPAQGSAGLRMYVDGLETAERAELFPVLSGLSALDGRELPAGASPAAVLQSGFGHNGRDLGYGIVLQNPNAGHAIEALEYQVTAYGADGTVLGTDQGHAPTLLAEQTLGVGGKMYLIVDEPVERLQAQVSGGEFVEFTSEQLAFTAEEPAFEPGSFSGEVSGFVTNPYPQNVTNLYVSAILYDDAGQIIGGGYSYLEDAPAQSRSAVQVPVNGNDDPATVELHAAPDGRSVFGE